MYGAFPSPKFQTNSSPSLKKFLIDNRVVIFIIKIALAPNETTGFPSTLFRQLLEVNVSTLKVNQKLLRMAVRFLYSCVCVRH